MRFLILAALATSLAGSANASPAFPWANDANQRCVNDNFKQTMEFVDRGRKLRVQIETELEKPATDWPMLRRLIVELRRNDILFRQESYRVELKCLDEISAEDRIASLKREFRQISPPPILQVKPSSK
jgi:hypothetical protein